MCEEVVVPAAGDAPKQPAQSKARKPSHAAAWAFASVVLVAFVVVALLLYALITERVIDSSLQSSEELALHDEASIENSLRFRWDALRGIGEECRQSKCATISELLNLLRVKEQSLDCLDLELLGSDGMFYCGSLRVESDPGLKELCEGSGDEFAARYDSVLSKSAESHRECLVFGVKVKPFEVEGVTFDYLVCRMAVNTLSQELKIDSYGGEGYSSVIDPNGDYIVSLGRDSAVTNRDNFFENLWGWGIADGTSVEDIQDAIEREEAFTVAVDQGAGPVIMQFTPMEANDWYFVTSVPRAVFERQSMEILKIVVAIMVAMLLAVAVALFLMLRSRQARVQAAADESHRRELARALDLAEQANRAKTTFLSSMSHDIRTPMNAIIGFTSLAKMRLGDEERVRDYLEKIAQSSDHLLALINDVLDMSRIESGKVVIDERPDDLARMLDDVRSIIQPEVDKRAQTLAFDVDAHAHTAVYVDRLRLNQVLLNLLSNAVKFTPDGGTITVSAVQLAQEDDGDGGQRGTFRLSVSDTGIGMSPEFAATVFESFTREQTATVSGIQGTGLGMAITKNIIELMGGAIEVESEQGAGTTFTVTFPLRLDMEERAPGEPSAASSAEAALSEASFAGMRLLLVDDNLLGRELASEILVEAGFEVETAEDGAQAVEAVRNSQPGHFDVVLCDVQMPVMDGYEATRRIRRLDDAALASVPIVALTANAFEEDVKDALDAGMDAHMGKPIEIPVLVETLTRVLGAAGGKGRSGAPGADAGASADAEAHDARASADAEAHDMEAADGADAQADAGGAAAGRGEEG